MSCTPPRTPSPNHITSMPVSVIMLGRKDGTAEPVGRQLRQTLEPSAAVADNDGEGRFDNGPHIYFIENKNTDRARRNANFGIEQIFVANKDTNRETVVPAPADRHRVPVAIAPKMGPNSAANNSATAGHRIIPMPATATIFLAPCDSNGQITHFVLTAAPTAPPAPQNPISKVNSIIIPSINNESYFNMFIIF